MRARISTLRVSQSDDRYPTENPPAAITKTGQFGSWRLHVRFGQIDANDRQILALMGNHSGPGWTILRRVGA